MLTNKIIHLKKLNKNLNKKETGTFFRGKETDTKR